MDRPQAEARIRELRQQIQHHDFRYYVENRPEITDAQHDALVQELRGLEAAYPDLVTPDSPTQRVGGVVAEGRDIGTVVFPVADVKIYLDASPEERARRRFAELRSQGKQVTLEETLEEMKERDRRDQERAVAPLRKAENALVVDSSRLGAEAVVEQVMREIKNKLRAI